MKLSHSR